MKKEIRKIEMIENKALNNDYYDVFEAAFTETIIRGYEYGKKGFASHVDWLITAHRNNVIALDLG